MPHTFHRNPLLQLKNTYSSRSIHPHTLPHEITRRSDPILTTKLIHASCRAGKINDARKLFDEMPEKNIVSFSTIIYGYAQNGFFTESLQLFSQMQELGFSPNSFTVVAVLVSSAGMGVLKLGESIHGRIIKSGLDSNLFVRSAMLDAYAKCGDAVKSYRLFKEMGDPSLVSCNAMIAGFVHNYMFEEALLLFKRFRAFGPVPNSVTMLSITRSCIGFGSFGVCESMHCFVVKVGFDLNVSVMNSVFDMYLSFGSLEIATDFFRKMAVTDVISCTTMMGFFLQLEFATEALNIFHLMRANGIAPDMVSMVQVITACVLLGDLEKGRLVHNQIVVRGFSLELPVMNSLIAMYSKCGDLKSARMSFDHIQDKNLVSWTAMTSGYLQNGQPRKGLGLLTSMRIEKKFKLDSVALVSSLTACRELASLELCKQFHAYSFKAGFLLCNSVQNSLVAAYGRCGDIDLAHRVFEEMICLDRVSWNVIISSYGINGKGEAALSLFLEMDKCGVEPDSVTYLSVLNACSHSGLIDDGLIIFERMMKEKRVNPTAEHYGCVVDMLARGGRLEDARKLVNSMSEEVGPNVWKALLGGCHLHSNVRIAELAADRLLGMDSEDSGNVVLLSNVYGSVGRFDDVEALRFNMDKKGLVKNLGFTLLDAVPSDFG